MLTKQTIGAMSYSQLINLFILFGLISYSYEYNVPRRSRDIELKEETKNEFRSLMENPDVWENRVKHEWDGDRDTVDNICHDITEGVNRMANAGPRDISCGAHWMKIQGSLRRGIQVIIESYRRYIGVHRDVCQSIESFAENMILKYEAELAAIDEMTAPIDNVDLNSEGWNRFASRYSNMLDYARVHEETLRTAADCTADLAARTVYHQRYIVRTPPQRVIRLVQSNPDYPVRSLSIPCHNIEEDNGCQACPNAISDHSRSYANAGCGGCMRRTTYY